MTMRYEKTNIPGGQEKKKQAAEGTTMPADDACRCKEVSEMKPRQLLRLMMGDLAFWKKMKKG